MITAEGPSELSLLGAGLYVLVALACIMTALAARGAGEARSGPRGWLVIGACFLLFALMRFLQTEDILGDLLRGLFERFDAREDRQTFQWPLSLLALAIVAVSAVRFTRRIRAAGIWSRSATVDWARMATLCMVALIGLRLISLHRVDAILFSPAIGPLRINWMLDIGFSATVLIAALAYAGKLRSSRRM
ncbi:hypothetical protein [Altererythrobacter sp. Z27]|uniref:hypothetical protein n=1 Tax=Altererythrobacter sp. Z27 TaxID=3461147 RepID=UPI004043F829